MGADTSKIQIGAEHFDIEAIRKLPSEQLLMLYTASLETTPNSTPSMSSAEDNVSMHRRKPLRLQRKGLKQRSVSSKCLSKQYAKNESNVTRQLPTNPPVQWSDRLAVRTASYNPQLAYEAAYTSHPMPDRCTDSSNSSTHNQILNHNNLNTTANKTIVGATLLTADPDMAFISGRPHLSVNGVPALLPADTAAMVTQDMLHDTIYYALGTTHFSPIPQPREILDVGCGSGRWLSDMAKVFPNCHMHGVDIIEPTQFNNLPSGCKVTLADVHDGLPFESNRFDLVHQQALRFFIPNDRWPLVAEELFRVCRPGGYAELVEYDFVADPTDREARRLLDALTAVTRMGGVEWDAAQHLSKLLRISGFEKSRCQIADFTTTGSDDATARVLAKIIARLLRDCRPLVVDRFNLLSGKEFDNLVASTCGLQGRPRIQLKLYIITGRKPTGVSGTGVRFGS